MLEKHGAERIVAIEANSRAFLKCLVAKEVLDLRRAQFRCGDFVEYLRSTTDRFDLCVASGVLYHMKNPVELLTLLAKVSDRVFLWTHYYDAAVVAASEHVSARFTAATESTYGGFRHTLHRFEYSSDALGSHGFCGGGAEFSQWLERSDILAALAHVGLGDTEVAFEHKGHQNGPCFAVLAQRPTL